MVVASLLVSAMFIGAGPRIDLSEDVPSIVVESRDSRWIQSARESLERHLRRFIAAYDCSLSEAECASAEVLQAWAEQVVYEDAGQARLAELLAKVEAAGEGNEEDSPHQQALFDEFRAHYLGMPCDPEVLRQRMEMCSAQADFTIPRQRWAELYLVWDFGMGVAEEDILRTRRLTRRMKRYRERVAGGTSTGRPVPTWRYLNMRNEAEAAASAAEEGLAAATVAGRLPSQRAPAKGIYVRVGSRSVASNGVLRPESVGSERPLASPAPQPNAKAGSSPSLASDDSVDVPADAHVREVRADVSRRTRDLGRKLAVGRGLAEDTLARLEVLTDAADARAWAYLEARASAYELSDALTRWEAYRRARAELDGPVRAMLKEFEQRIEAIVE